MSKFSLTEMAVKMFCPGNVVQLDDAGLPSVLVYIPAFKNSDVLTGGNDDTHPAFIVNGKEIPGFYYSKYENVVYNGMAYSLPAEDPKASITIDEARAACESKGYGWHLSTAAEWAAIALWCKKNGFMPYGNNNNGKDHRESEYKAVPVSYNADGTITKVATGTGPLTWSHDGTASGIWDMGGNLWEWQGGFRLVWGEIQILANNDAADPDNPQNATSTCWKAINAADGSLVEPESSTEDAAGATSGNTVKLDFVDNVWKFSTNITSVENESRGCRFGNVTHDDTVTGAAMLLRALALLPEEGATAAEYGNDSAYWNNGNAERSMSRSGNWGHVSGAGVFYVGGGNPGRYVGAQLGFRAAYIPELV